MIRRAEQGGPLRKVAILVRSLDAAAAERLLSAMSTADAAEVRALAARLDDCSPQESEAVLGEFLRATGRNAGRSPSDSGVELELSSAVSTALPAEPRASTASSPAPPDSAASRRSRPLNFVSIEAASRVATLLEREGDAVGAAILAMLEPEVAARVLETLPLERQRTLLARLAKTGRPEPMIAEELTALVREHLEATAESDDEIGLETVQAILGQVDHRRREQLIGDSAPVILPFPTERVSTTGKTEHVEVSRDDSPAMALASRVMNRNGAGAVPRTSTSNETRDESSASAPRAATSEEVEVRLTVEQQQDLQRRFDGLGDWSEDALLSLLKRVPPRVLRIAMVGASAKLIRRVLKPLRRTDAERLRAEWERPGAVRLADIATAQRAILLLAGRRPSGSTEVLA